MNKSFFFLLFASFFLNSFASENSYIIGSTLGRLGNYLFEVAAVSALAWDNNVEAYFPDLDPTKCHFNYKQHIFFRCKTTSPSDQVKFYWSGPVYGYKPIEYKPFMHVSGYLQNEKYFAHQRQKILDLFAPHPKDLAYIKKKYKTLLDHPKTVSIHVRFYQGESLDKNSFFQYGEEYFQKAMAIFSHDCLFVVFSDNIDYAKQIIHQTDKNVIFIEKEPFYIDFHLQSLCKHNIISNSSFSWWSAWLNKNPDKIVVRPKKWVGGYPDIGSPEEWIRIDANYIE